MTWLADTLRDLTKKVANKVAICVARDVILYQKDVWFKVKLSYTSDIRCKP